jgi:4'-phosphopantetheinyl transferase
VRRRDAAAIVCEIHWARIDSLRSAPSRILDRRERERAARYMRHEDRIRFTAGAVLLRLLTGMRLGVEPQGVRIDRTCQRCGEPHGRPRLPGCDLEVSVSHSGRFVVVATTDAPVGVDVEQVRPLDHRAVERVAFTPEEREATPHLAAFYGVWTRKESVLKAAGVGLRMPMAKVRVTPAMEPPRLLRYGDAATPAARMIDTAPSAGYAGAVTVLTSLPVAFRGTHADDLLGGS